MEFQEFPFKIITLHGFPPSKYSLARGPLRTAHVPELLHAVAQLQSLWQF
jgi:hypothetical protein